jgi:hypothetical protein
MPEKIIKRGVGRPKGMKNKPDSSPKVKNSISVLRFLDGIDLSNSPLPLLKNFTPAELDLLDFIFSNYKTVINKGTKWLCKKSGHSSKTLYTMIAKPEFQTFIFSMIQGIGLIHAPEIAAGIYQDAITNRDSFSQKTALQLAGFFESAPKMQFNIANIASNPNNVGEQKLIRIQKQIVAEIGEIETRIAELRNGRTPTREAKRISEST